MLLIPDNTENKLKLIESCAVWVGPQLDLRMTLTEASVDGSKLT